MTDYDMATLMKGVREYAEGFDVKLGEVAPGEHGDIARRKGDAYNITEPRLVVWGLNEGGHNSVQIDVKDLLGWLVEHRPELVREALGTTDKFLPPPSTPLYKVDDRVIVQHSDGTPEFILTITKVALNYGGLGWHRYWGDTTRGPRGAYESQIKGRAQ